MADLKKRSFGMAPNGRPADLYVLDNGRGLEAEITNYGGIVVALRVPDRHGRQADVVLGHSSAAGYARNTPYIGALIGRVANRIARARFTLDGRTHKLAANDGPNHLHGGRVGFDQATWSAAPVADDDGPALELHHVSPDGDEGYPGRVEVRVVYTLTHEGALRIRYEATSDRATPLNLTSHGYFNLGATNDILDHEIRIPASRVLQVDAGLIPTGAVRDVAGSALDLREPVRIRDRIGAADEQVRIARGFDHAFVLDGQDTPLATAAEVYDRSSGRAMRVRTTAPSIQFYSGNFLDGSIVGKDGRRYGPRAALCLEAEGYPDAPNHPGFPSIVVRPGEVYRQTTAYEFTAL